MEEWCSDRDNKHEIGTRSRQNKREIACRNSPITLVSSLFQIETGSGHVMQSRIVSRSRVFLRKVHVGQLFARRDDDDVEMDAGELRMEARTHLSNNLGKATNG